MEKIQTAIRSSLSTKVIITVACVMALLLAVTVWTVNDHLTRQFRSEAARSLGTARVTFQRFDRIRAMNLLMRFRNLPKQPLYKAAFQAGDAPTLRDLLGELRGEQGLDLVTWSSDQKELVASAKLDPLIPISQFESASAPAIAKALHGEEQLDTICVADRLFEIVSIPVFGTGDYLIGALTLGSEIGNAAAQDLRDFTQCQIVLLANGRVVASTLPNPEPTALLNNIFADSLGRLERGDGPADVQLGTEHYYCSAGRLTPLSGDSRLGYLLFSSYELPWRALRSTQQVLLLSSAGGILLGIAIVGFFVRKVTHPLRQLRDSAEAIGRGDFSHRVEAASNDECGELALVFNRMTEKIKDARETLEMTVETLKTTQAQLIQSEKLSGIGEFVAGVAHELNNPLTSVMGFSELLKNADGDPEHKRFLEVIHKSALRCQKIVQSLLSFARRHQPERKFSAINQLIESAVEILHYQLRTSNIEVITQLDPALPMTMVDPHQVQQVILNIINNARQAIEAHRPKGCIRIASEACGQTIRINIQDDGPGISEQDLSKVFDPFFTTKEVGKGTGLGLSLCYGIIKEHGGVITVRSKPGDGATFTIVLPIAKDESQPAQPATFAAAAPVPSGEGRGKRVLVIDDEEAILQMVREALVIHGYEVDLAQDGESGLRRLTQKSYDLALCDWKMPGLNGQQVYERLRAADPALAQRMIFITGDVINDNAQQFLRDSRKVCLPKPFSLEEFRTAISQALKPA